MKPETSRSFPKRPRLTISGEFARDSTRNRTAIFAGMSPSQSASPDFCGRNWG